MLKWLKRKPKRYRYFISHNIEWNPGNNGYGNCCVTIDGFIEEDKHIRELENVLLKDFIAKGKQCNKVVINNFILLGKEKR